jgi:signal transduction histidine kinase
VGAAIDSYLSHTLTSERIEYTVHDDTGYEPPPNLRTILYRVAQEAISNARRHGRPSRIDVELWNNDGGWSVRVRDDGVGFDARALPTGRPGHLGLIGMRERVETSGGRVEIESAPGQGTTVEFWLPAEGGIVTGARSQP